MKGFLGEEAASTFVRAQSMLGTIFKGRKGAKLMRVERSIEYSAKESLDILAMSDKAELLFGEVKHWSSSSWSMATKRAETLAQLERHNAGITTITNRMSRRASDVTDRVLYVSRDGFQGMEKSVREQFAKEVKDRGWRIEEIPDEAIGEFGDLMDQVAEAAMKPWGELTPAERHRFARDVVTSTLPSRRGGLTTALAELFDERSDATDGLWIVEEESEPDDVGASPEDSARLLDQHTEEMREARLAAGPRAGTQLLLRLLELPAVAVTKARKVVTKRGGREAAEAILVEHAVAEQQSQVEGEHAAIKRLLEAVPARVRVPHDVYTPTGARALLAAIELQRAGEDEVKPLAWFKGALRRAVEHENGFAVVFSTTLL